jgi:hypothetical protein
METNFDFWLALARMLNAIAIVAFLSGLACAVIDPKGFKKLLGLSKDDDDNNDDDGHGGIMQPVTIPIEKGRH